MAIFLARVDAYHRDELYWGFDALTWDVPIARDASITPAYSLYNAGFSGKVDDNLSLTLWRKNLADKVDYDGGVGVSVSIVHVNKGFATRRRYGIDVRFDF